MRALRAAARFFDCSTPRQRRRPRPWLPAPGDQLLELEPPTIWLLRFVAGAAAGACLALFPGAVRQQHNGSPVAQHAAIAPAPGASR